MNQTNTTQNVPVLRLMGLEIPPDHTHTLVVVVIIVRVTHELAHAPALLPDHAPALLPDHRTNEVVVRDQRRVNRALTLHDTGELIVPDHDLDEIARLRQIPAHGLGDIIVLTTVYIINTRFREPRVDHSSHWRIIFGGSVFEGGYVEAAAVGFLLGVVLAFAIRGLFFLLKFLRNAL